MQALSKKISTLLSLGLVALAFISPGAVMAQSAAPTVSNVNSSSRLTSGIYDFPNAPNVPVGTSQAVSANWSGYVADTGTYTSVTGTWIVPNVPTTNVTSADATWVGIGGANTTDLIQAGTQAIIQNGQTTYEAWYETLPNVSTPVSLTVQPGDSITATINETSTNNWLITIRDNTTGNTYTNTLNYSSSLSSAEWIEEMPNSTSGYLPLDNFGSVDFSNASATIDGVPENLMSLGAHAVTMTTAGNQSILANTSALGSDGESFTVTRTNNASDTTSSQSYIVGRRGFIRTGQGAPDAQGNWGQTVQVVRYQFTSGSGTSTPTQQIQSQTFTVGPYTVQVNFGSF